MKKIILFALLIVTSAIALYRAWSSHSRKDLAKREVFYRERLEQYSLILKPGMTRREIDDGLNRRGISFITRSGDDLIELAHEPSPHCCCSYELISVAVYYESPRSNPDFTYKPTDRVRAVDLDRWPQDCL
jgi:hypothetical protein